MARREPGWRDGVPWRELEKRSIERRRLMATRVFPVGSDTVEIMTDGENITASCTVCHPPVVIASWSEYALLNEIIVALYEHQDHVNRPKESNV